MLSEKSLVLDNEFFLLRLLFYVLFNGMLQIVDLYLKAELPGVLDFFLNVFFPLNVLFRLFPDFFSILQKFFH